MNSVTGHLTFNDYTYRINIYFPENKKPAHEYYPVLYVLDGDKYGVLLREIVKLQSHRTSKTGVGPYIIVSIELTEEITKRRYYDFTRENKEGNASEVNQIPYPVGGAYQFNEFLQNDVKQFVYHVLNDTPQKEVLFGHSLTAYYGLHLLESKPELFTDYILLSPSIWWNQQEVLDYEFSKIDQTQSKIYIAAGELEIKLVTGVQKLKSELSHYKNVRVQIFENENHASIIPTAISSGLRHVQGNQTHN